MRRGLLLSAWVVCLMAIALLPGGARADGAGAVSFTQTLHNATAPMPVFFPCVGPPPGAAGIATTTANSVFHLTVLTSGVGAGTGWGTFTLTGTFVFVPDNPSLPTFTGRVTVWDGDNINLNNFASTAILVIHATGSDGSAVMFHDVAHVTLLTTTSPPTVVVSFDMPTCG